MIDVILFACGDCNATLMLRPKGLKLFGGQYAPEWFMVKLRVWRKATPDKVRLPVQRMS